GAPRERWNGAGWDLLLPPPSNRPLRLPKTGDGSRGPRGGGAWLRSGGELRRWGQGLRHRARPPRGGNDDSRAHRLRRGSRGGLLRGCGTHRGGPSGSGRPHRAAAGFPPGARAGQPRRAVKSSDEEARWRLERELLDCAALAQRMSGEGAAAILTAVERITASFQAGGKLLLCGNGGSAADCQRMAAELVSRLSRERERPALSALALTTDTSFLTAYSNDHGFEGV